MCIYKEIISLEYFLLNDIIERENIIIINNSKLIKKLAPFVQQHVTKITQKIHVKMLFISTDYFIFLKKLRNTRLIMNFYIQKIAHIT